MLMAQGISMAVFGVGFFSDPELLRDYQKSYALPLNWLLLAFQHLGLFVVPALLFASLVHREPRRLLGFRRPRAQTLVFAALLILLSVPMVNALVWLNEGMQLPSWLYGLELAMQKLEEQARELTDLLTSGTSLWMLGVNILLVAALPALGEEMVFRGLVLPIFHRWTGSIHAAVWLSAALFSAMHMQFYGFLPRLVLGAVLGYLFVGSRNIWIPILAHFANNATALTLVFLMNSEMIDESIEHFEPSAPQVLFAALSTLSVIAAIVWYLRRMKPMLAILPPSEDPLEIQ